MKNRIQFLYAILAFFAAEAIQMIIVIGYEMFYTLLVGFKAGYEKASQGITNSTDYANVIQKSMSEDILYLISAFAVLVCGVIFFFWYRTQTRGEVMGSVRDTFRPKNVLLLIIMGGGCQLFITGIMNVSQKYFTDLFKDYTEQMGLLTSGNVFVVLLLMIFVAPITEELVFRGVILNKASKAIPFWGANLLQAMLFGLYHMNVIQGIYAAMLGFILGLICHKFKTIYASMFLHMVINTSSLPVALFPQNNSTYYVMIISGGICLFLSLFIIKITKPVVIDNFVNDTFNINDNNSYNSTTYNNSNNSSAYINNNNSSAYINNNNSTANNNSNNSTAYNNNNYDTNNNNSGDNNVNYDSTNSNNNNNS